MASMVHHKPMTPTTLTQFITYDTNSRLAPPAKNTLIPTHNNKWNNTITYFKVWKYRIGISLTSTTCMKNIRSIRISTRYRSFRKKWLSCELYDIASDSSLFFMMLQISKYLFFSTEKKKQVKLAGNFLEHVSALRRRRRWRKEHNIKKKIMVLFLYVFLCVCMYLMS